MYANAPSVGTIKGLCQIPIRYIVINTHSSCNGALKYSCPVVDKNDGIMSSYGGKTPFNLLCIGATCT